MTRLARLAVHLAVGAAATVAAAAASLTVHDTAARRVLWVAVAVAVAAAGGAAWAIRDGGPAGCRLRKRGSSTR